MRRLLPLIALAALLLPAAAEGRQARTHHHAAHHALRHHRAHKSDIEADEEDTAPEVPEATDTEIKATEAQVEQAEHEGAFVVEA